MRTTPPEKLAQLQKNPANVRNICILAHVDHGKTTIADALVASNGIISPRMAGKLRYMDSREDEQVRGITMKSSGISLFYHKDSEDFLINLIDSPGHVDFSSEVSTAVRLCDGALMVVDVVEGVSPQTHAVLRQAWLENIRLVLILNKIDRLITEVKMEPLQAYIHLQKILEQINVITSELFTSEHLEKTANVSESTTGRTRVNSNSEQVYDWSIEDSDDSHIYFSPDQGNVIFASALDGWGFSIAQFSEMYSKKLEVNPAVLQKSLWGDFYYNGKTKKIMTGAQMKAKKPLFVQCVLENLWAVYEAVLIRKDKEKMAKIVKSLDLKIAPRDARHTDARVCLQAVCNQWLPLSGAVLDMVTEKLPSPLSLSEERTEKLMCSRARQFDSLPVQTQQLKNNFIACDASEDSPVIVYVSKMFAVERKSLPQNRQRPLTNTEIEERRLQARQRIAVRREEALVRNEESASIQNPENCIAIHPDNLQQKPGEQEGPLKGDQVFLAFARVFSGAVRKGQQLYVLGPKHDPTKALEELKEKGEVETSDCLSDLTSTRHITSFTVEELYLCMGRELESLTEVPAGNIIGIGGLEEHILKSATISSTVACPPFTDLYFEAAPIVRVAIEPKQAGEMTKLVQGLKLLNQADPCVEVLVQETGEHVIIAAGEVHLQRCIDDLTDRFAKIEINASKPIVPFRETIIKPPKVDMVNESIQDTNQPVKLARYLEFEDDSEVISPGVVVTMTADRKCTIRIRALPLPEDVIKLLEPNAFLIKTLDEYHKQKFSGKIQESSKSMKLSAEVRKSLAEFRANLSSAFQSSGKEWRGAEYQIWSFGPRRTGPNILLNRVPDYQRPSVWDCLETEEQQQQQQQKSELRPFESSIVSGFQMATLAGPMCEEPMLGVCFVIEQWENSDARNTDQSCDRTTTKGNNSRWGENEENVVDSAKENVTESSNWLSSHLERIPKSEQPSDSQQPAYPESSMETKGNNSSDNIQTDEDVSRLKRKQETYGPFSGQLMSCVKDGCRKAFQTQPQRLYVAMYKCEIQATSEVLGKLYAVLGKRFGCVVAGDMREGSQIFNIEAHLPVVESFGFADDFRKKTSGLARPQLTFSHWELLDVDPYWVPTTEEEYLHYGEKADNENRARAYMNAVRRRKGLHVEEKLVEHAEKQRTLSKNK